MKCVLAKRNAGLTSCGYKVSYLFTLLNKIKLICGALLTNELGCVNLDMNKLIYVYLCIDTNKL